jgi:hypothetical protein
MSNTSCGQTFTHIPQPLHLASHNSSVTTSGKYISSFIVGFYINLEIIKRIIPIADKDICKGSALFISFFTPERDVYVDEPVKFIARNDDTAGMMRNHAAFIRTIFPRNPVRHIINANKIPT